ncbi:MAG: hypothetical protein AB1798_03245 [Spirochaetota bacterium]
MKKMIVTSLLITILVCLFFACTTTSTSAEKPPSDIPDFYLNPPTADDAVYGVGSAKMAKLDMSRKMALARAREDIAFQIAASIKAAVTDYAQEAGVDDNNQVINFAETVSKQITNTKLTGAKTEKIAVGKDGTIYALVMYPVNQFVKDAESEFVRNEDAAFAEFKASEAVKRLENEIKTNPPKSKPVSE